MANCTPRHRKVAAASQKTPPCGAGAGHTGDAALCAPRQRRHAGTRAARVGRGARAARGCARLAGRMGRKAPPRRAARHNAKRESLRGAGRPRQKRSGCPARDGVGVDGGAPRQRRHAGHAGTRAARVGRGARAARRAGSARGTRGTQSAASVGGASQCKTGKPPRGGAPQAKAERLPGAGRGRPRLPGARRGQSRLRVRLASASSRRKFTSDASAASTYVMAAARSTFFAASDSSYVT